MSFRFTAIAILLAALAGWVATWVWAITAAPLVYLLLAGAAVTSFIWRGAARSRGDDGRIDPFAPTVIPAAYIAVSFLVPSWWYFVRDETLGDFTKDMMVDFTPALMTVAVAATLLGLSVRWRRYAPTTSPADPAVLIWAGRALLLIPLSVGLYNLQRGGAAIKGVGQTEITTLDAISVAATVAGPAAVLMILSARRQLHTRGLLVPTDWAIIAGVMVVSAVGGSRAPTIALVLCLLYGHIRRGGSLRAAAAIVAAIGVFAVLVAFYRTEAAGGVVAGDSSPFDVLVTDLSVATYTTGITARHVPTAVPYKGGITVFDAVLRQLPSPIANRLLGPPSNTGDKTFRQLIGTSDPNQGWGYSLPAEGYLNIGTIGLAGFCFLYGLVISWAYARTSWPATTATALLYPVLVAAMPIAIRSDMLGLIKSGLYPVIISGAMFALARESHRQRNLPMAFSRDSNEERPSRAVGTGSRGPRWRSSGGSVVGGRGRRVGGSGR